MAVLKCDSCGAKVQSNKCCNAPMKVEGNNLKCESCGKTVEVNFCCGHAMHEHKEESMHEHHKHKH